MPTVTICYWRHPRRHPAAAQSRDRSCAATRPRRLVGRGLADVLRRTGGNYRVRRRTVAHRGRVARGHQGAATIKSKLCSVGRFDPNEWDLPPKPKWMRWRTYNRMVERFDRYEAMVEEGLLGVVKRLGLSKNISN